jgi:hypothetical protein
MDLGIKAGDFLAALAGALFAFWPFLVLAPITWQRTSLPRTARAMLALWACVGIAGVASRLIPFPRLVIIAEPANSLLFVGTGAALLAIYIVTRSRR